MPDSACPSIPVQGYMLCQPKDRLSGLRPISFCVKINGSDIDYMRRNYDSPSPGEFRQAIGAMEASIQVRCHAIPACEASRSLSWTGVCRHAWQVAVGCCSLCRCVLGPACGYCR